MRYFYQGTSKDGTGRVICDATISVYLAGGYTVANIYTASTGGVAVNSVTSGSTTSSSPGYFSFWIDRGDYFSTQQFRLVISKSGFNPQIYDYISVGVISQPWVDAKTDFGAVGDGVTDDTAAIQAAITAAAYRRVYIPKGTYLHGDLTISSPMQIFGDGIVNSVLKAKTGTTTMFAIASDYVTIHDLDFDGNDQATRAIYGTTVDNITIRNIYVAKTTAHGIRFQLSAGEGTHENITIEDCLFGAKSGVGTIPCIQIDGDWTAWPTGAQWKNINIHRIRSSGNDGTYLNATKKSVVSDSELYGGTDSNLNAEYCDMITFSNNYSEGCTQKGITFYQYVTNSKIIGGMTYDNVENVYIGPNSSDNEIIGHTSVGGATTTKCASITSTLGGNKIVGGKYIASSGASGCTGINLDSNLRTGVIGVTVEGISNGQAIVLNQTNSCSIIGNTINGGDNGIYLLGTVGTSAVNNQISGNHFLGQSTLSWDEANTYVSGNTFIGNYLKTKTYGIQAAGGAILSGNVNSVSAKIVNNYDIEILTAGKGTILTNAAGTVTKRVRLNDAGDGLIFEAE